MGRVSLDHVSKRFDDVAAVDDLTLDVADEELLVLLGPSGCGKSTALRMIAGLEDPTAGTISIGERVVNDVEAKDRDISMVFQSYALYPHMTVRKNIEFPLRSRKVPSAERDQLVREAAVEQHVRGPVGFRLRPLARSALEQVAGDRRQVLEPERFSDVFGSQTAEIARGREGERLDAAIRHAAVPHPNAVHTLQILRGQRLFQHFHHLVQAVQHL
jgi:multiple sugar transport system ATP-binding protein